MDIIGIGYLGFETTCIDQWREYGPQVLGFQIGNSPEADPQSLYFRTDDRRHRFAFQSLLQWYRDGEDVERRLPVLSAYLGHTEVRDTYWYLSARPELMSLAQERLERHWEARS